MLPARKVELREGSPDSRQRNSGCHRSSSAAARMVRRVKLPGRIALKPPLHPWLLRPSLLQGQMLPASSWSWEMEFPTHPKQPRLHQEQALQAARVKRRMKPPRADCLEDSTAYPTASTVVAAGTDASSEHVELGEGQMPPASTQSWEKESSTTARATAATTGVSSASSTRDEACENLLGRTALKPPLRT